MDNQVTYVMLSLLVMVGALVLHCCLTSRSPDDPACRPLFSEPENEGIERGGPREEQGSTRRPTTCV